MKEKEIRKKLGDVDAKIILKNPAEMAKEQKRIDKLSAMRITLTYIETQSMRKVSPEKTMEIADKYMEWLKK